MIIRAKEGKKIFLVCLLVFRCETFLVDCLLPYTASLYGMWCTQTTSHIFRKEIAMSCSPSLQGFQLMKHSPGTDCLLPYLACVLHTWNTQALHRTIQQTFPTNVNTISGGRKCYKGRNRLLCSGYRASSRWKHWLPPSPPVTARHTHFFHETTPWLALHIPYLQQACMYPHPHALSLPPHLCVPTSPRSLPPPNRPMCRLIPTLPPSLQPAIVSKADVDQTRINPKLLHFPPTIVL